MKVLYKITGLETHFVHKRHVKYITEDSVACIHLRQEIMI